MKFPRRDLNFLLYEWLGVVSLTARERFAEHSRETFDAALDTAEKIAADYFAPHNKKSDANEPTFDGAHVHLIPDIKTAVDAFSAAGLLAAQHDADLGGMQLPATVANACMAHFMMANVATAAYRSEERRVGKEC